MNVHFVKSCTLFKLPREVIILTPPLTPTKRKEKKERQQFNVGSSAFIKKLIKLIKFETSFMKTRNKSAPCIDP